MRRSVCGWRFRVCVCCVVGGGWWWWLGVAEEGWALRLYDTLDENKHVHLRPDDARDVSRSLVQTKHAESRPQQQPPQRRQPPVCSPDCSAPRPLHIIPLNSLLCATLDFSRAEIRKCLCSTDIGGCTQGANGGYKKVGVGVELGYFDNMRFQLIFSTLQRQEGFLKFNLH